MEKEALPVVVHTHVGSMHRFGCFPIDAPGGYAELLPDLATLFRSSRHQGQTRFPGTVVLLHGICQLTGELQIVFAVNGNAVLSGHTPKLFGAFYRVTPRFAFGNFGKDLHEIPPVIGVARGPGSNRSTQISGNNDVRVGPADPFLRPLAERVYPAGSHDTVAAAQAHFAVTALRLLSLETIPCGLDSVVLRLGQHRPAVFGYRLRLEFFSGAYHCSLLSSLCLSRGELKLGLLGSS